jgi:sigma-B regulation protein RsbU (phosphoserine phosphatase)
MNDTNAEKGFVKTISDDIRSGNLLASLREDWKELKEFYLDEKRKSDYAKMGKFSRAFKITWWLFKKLFYRLTPLRRILFLLGFTLVVIKNNYGNDNLHVVGLFLLVFLILLELKDKLLAKEELDAGRKVQRSLMPDDAPKIEGWDIWLYYRSANEVSGDLIDYLKVNEDRTDLMLADVSGKGLAAALLTSKLQSTIRALVSESTSLNNFISKVNTIFFRDTTPNTFASMFYLKMLKNYNTLEYINAGHIPPVFISDGAAKELGKGNLALGLSGKAEYDEREIKMRDGEMLVLYSDGLTETVDSEGNFFGEERMLKYAGGLGSLNCKDAGNKLIERIDNFRGDAKIHDDLSIIIIKKI